METETQTGRGQIKTPFKVWYGDLVPPTRTILLKFLGPLKMYHQLRNKPSTYEFVEDTSDSHHNTLRGTQKKKTGGQNPQ